MFLVTQDTRRKHASKEGASHNELHVRDIRAAAILSQAEFAAELGVSERTVQGWEAGTKPQPRHQRRLLSFAAQLEEGRNGDASNDGD